MTTRYSPHIFQTFLVSLDTLLNDGSIACYSGSMPASPADAPGTTLLGRITKDGTAWTAGSSAGGIKFAAPSAGITTMSKEPAENWVFTCSTTGTIGWGRFVGNPTDAGGSSNILPRIDFNIGLTGSGAACTMTKVTFTAIGETGTVQTFTIPFTNRA